MKKAKWFKRMLLVLFGLILLLIAAGFIYEQISRFNTKREFPLQGQLVNIGNHSLNCKYIEHGEPLVVFESGLGTAGFLTWEKVQEEVSKFTSTLSYNRAGILWSERGNNPKTGEAISDELYSLLKKSNHNGPYILVGHSMAGLMLRSFIAKHPTEVAGIVFVDVSHPDQLNRMPYLKPQGPAPWLAKFVCSIGIARLFKIGEFQYPNTLKTDSINIIANSYFPISIPAYLEESKKVKELETSAGKINSFGDIPLIVITGTNPERDDEKFRHEWFKMQSELMNLSTNSEHVFADRSGHYVQLEQPEIVVQAIQKLVTEHLQGKIRRPRYLK